MTYHDKTTGLAGIAALAMGALIAFAPMKAEAGVIYATSATEIGDASSRRGGNDRNNPNSALGSNFSTFFELGYEGQVEFTFGQEFFGPGSVIEITTVNPDNWPEAVEIQVGKDGVFQDTNPKIFTNSDTTFTFSGGPFDTVRLTDVTRDQFPDGAGSSGATGGFDVAAVGVNSVPSAVPLPASALLLLGGLGGLGGISALRRRKRTA